MGSVWLAEHLTLRTNVVVKFMSPALASDPTSLSRFSREASAAAQVKSPHVVAVLDHGVTSTGHPFIVMELLEGHDLSAELKAKKMLPPDDVAHIIEHVARALGRAHERGIIHRDIKPANIFLCDVGERKPFIKLLDFGIAKPIDDPSQVTMTGDHVGTPAFMSPEQVRGMKVDTRTDIWALGVLAFRALTGVLPFRGEHASAVAVAVATYEIPRPSVTQPMLAQYAPAIDEWFLRACCRDASMRFQTAREMADALWHVIGMPEQATGQWVRNSAPPASMPTPAAVSIPPPRSSTPGQSLPPPIEQSSPTAPRTMGGTSVTHAGPTRSHTSSIIAIAVSVVFFLGGIIAFMSSRSSDVPAPASTNPIASAVFSEKPTEPSSSVESSSAKHPVAGGDVVSAQDPAPTAASASQKAVGTTSPKGRPGTTTKKKQKEDPDDMGF